MTNAELQAYEAVKGIHREMKKANEPNWEQRRYEIAKVCLASIVGNYETNDVSAVKYVVGLADLLIEELKTKENNKNEKKD